MRLFLKGILVWVVTLGMLNTVVWAADESLYMAEIPVKSQSTEERTAVITKAYADLLVRISGNRKVLDQAFVPEVLEKAEQYVDQFTYKALEAGAASEDIEADRFLLTVRFNRRVVDDLLQRNKMPWWSAARPALISWVAIEENGYRRIISASENSQINDLLVSLGKKRGINTITPLMDIEDGMAVSVSDVWGLFSQPIEYASIRYSATTYWAGGVGPTDKGFEGNWMLVSEKGHWHWQTEGSSVEDVVALGYEQMADHLGDTYAFIVVPEEESDEVFFRVSGISSQQDYALSIRFIESLELIRRVAVSHISDGQMVLSVKLLGEYADVLESIRKSKKLTELKTAEGVDEVAFAWNP